MIDFYGNPRVMAIRKLGVLAPQAALAELESILAHWTRYGFGLWAVHVRETGMFAGECGLRWLEDGSDVELSYGLLPAFRGRGFATEAARAALGHAFGPLSLPRVVALSRGTNHVSHRVLEKCDMRLLWRRSTGDGGLVKYVLDSPGKTGRPAVQP